MRKHLFVLVCFIFLLSLSGCDTKTQEKDSKNNNLSKTNTIICSKTQTDEDGNVTYSESKVTYKNNYVLTVEETVKMDVNSEYFEITKSMMDSIFNIFDEIGGYEYNSKKEGTDKLVFTIKFDYEKVDFDKLKELTLELDENADLSYIKNNKVTYTDFKNIELEGYTCR